MARNMEPVKEKQPKILISTIVADELLRQMEEYRTGAKSLLGTSPDYAIRICQAIVAVAAGYEGRDKWAHIQTKG